MNNTDAVNVRLFTFDDISSLTELTHQLGYPTTEHEMQGRMTAIAQHPDYETAVAVLGEKIAGYIGMSRQLFWEQNGCFVRIQALVVDAAFRGYGVGRKLIEFAEDWGRQAGAHLLILNCGNKPERADAHQFYPRMGFQAVSTGYRKNITP